MEKRSIIFILSIFIFQLSQGVVAQETQDSLLMEYHSAHPDDTRISTEIQFIQQEEEPDHVIVLSEEVLEADTLILLQTTGFMPDPMKATWYALVCPGLGQIYNRSYWKLPILYGGVAVLSYLISWNGRMYNDYQNAYLDIMDNDPNTNSFEPIFYNMQGSETSWKQNTLKQKRDFYRRNRDLSIFGMVALYVISVLDSFVDAHLYNFSVSEDLSLKVEPVINSPYYLPESQPMLLGFQCMIQF